MKKQNPRKMPRSQADCNRAWREGCVEGMRVAEAIFLVVLHDKHSTEVNVKQVWDEIVDKTIALDKGYFTASDLRETLRSEYGIELLSGPSKAIAHDMRS